MPALSPTMKAGNIIEWKKKVGDSVAPGDVLADIETDKATMEFESQEEGYLAKILVPSGTQDVPVGKLVAILAEDKADVGSLEQFSSTESFRSSETEHSTKAKSIKSTSSVEKKLFGPAVRRMIEEYHISDLSRLTSSGAHGRILKDDVVEYLNNTGKETRKQRQEQQPKKPDSKKESIVTKQEDITSRTQYEDIPLNNMRKVIARRLTESKTQVPHEYCQIDCQLDKLLELRNIWKTEKNISVLVNDFIIRATAIALRKVPALNVIWDESSQSGKQMDRIDISMAVSIENGLITPIVMEADKKGLLEISNVAKDLIMKARQGKLKPEEFQGGTFSISNLGMFDIDQFTAVINIPQACILAIGTGEKQVLVENNQPVVHTVMKASLSYDARIVQEKDAIHFLREFSDIISSPQENMLL
ncbi:pyruvate dehydrogenase E2 component (dihydrolipoamideacetyltransferase) isoform 1 [Galdieria sulphuraria]|uniref:Dihydrolipoamide acetyltransferase component of pyruvate dehydrogenase complex n=1 Tax=Galdieria sulphuraria TaxID=130081 RepID=M2XT46_GALSU|nr:pyruvate dehydrogenase E2 component (dihydrolipoamideacetyltransferase) isoform 2 [Galdieria sulphuraria]XP_005703134.1 pyruvate dehydrogenase E2 component (dihydrolipoamideacetyltransferase) isoform 1 [Galdieria sulphuraria]EME26613.1 pyruvate dehydrogenase E2 component (dihydrolipoamideacetyltransferase) isoform 2 [Galdieria sulphuraria]EME26614.1 pyruvate dehydrogenase E2 component (dihydrolipoamideacetyltransferase) isoform 1 [Galdieria sulphuraria]|eukprot:XP_005703133.1 pyruvate dehydrogenase E2 component (dihydrolipoamideacetyltransferase) isoform 2 [Galdieria sulphuraria]